MVLWDERAATPRIATPHAYACLLASKEGKMSRLDTQAKKKPEYSHTAIRHTIQYAKLNRSTAKYSAKHSGTALVKFYQRRINTYTRIIELLEEEFSNE